MCEAFVLTTSRIQVNGLHAENIRVRKREKEKSVERERESEKNEDRVMGKEKEKEEGWGCVVTIATPRSLSYNYMGKNGSRTFALPVSESRSSRVRG